MMKTTGDTTTISTTTAAIAPWSHSTIESMKVELDLNTHSPNGMLLAAFQLLSGAQGKDAHVCAHIHLPRRCTIVVQNDGIVSWRRHVTRSGKLERRRKGQTTRADETAADAIVEDILVLFASVEDALCHVRVEDDDAPMQNEVLEMDRRWNALRRQCNALRNTFENVADEYRRLLTTGHHNSGMI